MRLINELRYVLTLLQFEDYKEGRIALLKCIHKLELEHADTWNGEDWKECNCEVCQEELEIELQFDSSLEGLEID